MPLNDQGLTFRSLILQKYPDLKIDHIHHAGNSSGVVDGSAALLLASPEYAKAHRPQGPAAASSPRPTRVIARP